LILLLAAILIRDVRRSSRTMETSLSASRAENETLEAAVAERTEHLLAAHEELRRSASVLQGTFNSMAEAVLVIDTKGTVVLANAAAETVLTYRPGMNMAQLRRRPWSTVATAPRRCLRMNCRRPVRCAASISTARN